MFLGPGFLDENVQLENMGIQTTIENTRIATQSVKGSIGKKGSFTWTALFLSPGLLFLWGFSAAEAPPALRLLPPGWLVGRGSIGLTRRGHNQNGIAREIITMFSLNFQDHQIEKERETSDSSGTDGVGGRCFSTCRVHCEMIFFIFSVNLYLVLFQKAYAWLTFSWLFPGTRNLQWWQLCFNWNL